METRLRVVVFGPPLNNSGGVGTLFEYFRDEVENQIDLKFVDTRGRSKHAWLSLFNLMFAIWMATKLRLQKKIDVAHVNMGSRGSAFRKLTLTLWLKRILHTPTALHLHASSFDTWMESSSPIVRKLVVSGINRADKMFVLGEVWKDKLVSLGVEEPLIQILVMGVPDLSKQIVKEPSKKGPIRILFAGEMSERKGLPSLLDAMSDERLEGYQLTVAGAGSTYQWREYLGNRVGLSRVQFVGHLPVVEVHRLLLASDILVLPSRAEGLPVSVMEAFSAQVAVVCTSVGALGSYLRDHENSLILRETGSAGIASCLAKLKDNDLRNSVAMGGRTVWSEHFDVGICSRFLSSEWSKLS